MQSDRARALFRCHCRLAPFLVALFGGAAHGQTPVAEPASRGDAHQTQELRIARGAGVELGCTLVLPAGRRGTRVPGAVLLTVAGPNDRDQSFADKAPFRRLAERLSAKGVASLRCDDRGIGASGGDWLQASYEVLAADATAMLERLAGEEGVDARRVGFIGNSEGGAIGPIAASEPSSGAAFVVLLAGPALSGEAALRAFLEAAIEVRNLDVDRAENLRQRFAELLAIVGRDPGDEATRADMRRFLQSGGAFLIPVYSFVPRELEGLTGFLLSPWYRSQVRYDPSVVIPEVGAPVLHLVGSRDTVLAAEQHHPAMRRLLEGREDGSDARVLQGLNHLFQVAETGSPTEYATLDEAYPDPVVAEIVEWIGAVTATD